MDEKEKKKIGFLLLTLFIIGIMFGVALVKTAPKTIDSYKYLLENEQEKLEVCTERQRYNFDAYMNASIDYQNCAYKLIQCEGSK